MNPTSQAFCVIDKIDAYGKVVGFEVRRVDAPTDTMADMVAYFSTREDADTFIADTVAAA